MDIFNEIINLSRAVNNFWKLRNLIYSDKQFKILETLFI